VSDELLPRVLATLRVAALTGRVGDAKIFVSQLCRAIRIHNGASGDAVLRPGEREQAARYRL
jgi:nitrogen regulatory protein PII